jgi:hypothetical protein
MRAELTIGFDAPRAVVETLARLGRTEDISFSPDNRRFALVCLDRRSIAIGDVEITLSCGAPAVRVTDLVEHRSSMFKTPHGIDFLDADTILVANRYGRVVALRVPPRGATGIEELLEPIELPEGAQFDLVGGPGSIRVLRDPPGPAEVLVCDNRRSTVTHHEVAYHPVRVTRNRVLLRHLLDFPDSVAISSDRQWMAVSNHDAHVVMVYRWAPSLSETSDPDCILRGTMYPHGLRFSPDDEHLIVADAGRPHLTVYRRGRDWRGVRYPDATVRVMSDDVYARGRDHESRGPKGIAIDNSGRVLAVTYEKQPIKFFDPRPCSSAATTQASTKARASRTRSRRSRTTALASRSAPRC